MRGLVLRLGEDEHVLQLVVHHIVLDDWSMGILLEELGLLHGAYAKGDVLPLEEPPFQYGDYAEWQRSWLTEEFQQRALEHWSERLDAIPSELPLPTVGPGPPLPRCTVRVIGRLPADTVADLRSLGRASGASFFVTMLAAFKVLLYRYTGVENIVVGTAVDNRGEPGLESMIGLFTNPVVLRSELSGDVSFRELLAGVRDRTLDAVAHQDLRSIAWPAPFAHASPVASRSSTCSSSSSAPARQNWRCRDSRSSSSAIRPARRIRP